MSDDTPDDLVLTRALRGLFPEHPLGREILGTRETVEAMGRDDDRRASTSAGTGPRNLVVAAAGDLDHDRVRRPPSTAVRPRRAPVRPRAPRRPAPTSCRWSSSTGPTEQAHVAVGLAGAARRRRRPLRPLGRQPGPRRGHVEPPVPGDPRGAGPGLLGVLVARRPTATSARSSSTPAPRPNRLGELLQVVDDTVDRPRRRRHHRRGARRRPGLPRGLDAARPRGQRLAAWPGSARASPTPRRRHLRRRARPPHPGGDAAPTSTACCTGCFDGPRAVAAVGPLGGGTPAPRLVRPALSSDPCH